MILYILFLLITAINYKIAMMTELFKILTWSINFIVKSNLDEKVHYIYIQIVIKQHKK